MEMKKFNYLLEIDILRNSSQTILGVLIFKGLGVQRDTQTPCWLRLWYTLYNMGQIVKQMEGDTVSSFGITIVLASRVSAPHLTPKP